MKKINATNNLKREEDCNPRGSLIRKTKGQETYIEGEENYQPKNNKYKRVKNTQNTQENGDESKFGKLLGLQDLSTKKATSPLKVYKLESKIPEYAKDIKKFNKEFKPLDGERIMNCDFIDDKEINPSSGTKKVLRSKRKKVQDEDEEDNNNAIENNEKNPSGKNKINFKMKFSPEEEEINKIAGMSNEKCEEVNSNGKKVLRAKRKQNGEEEIIESDENKVKKGSSLSKLKSKKIMIPMISILALLVLSAVLFVVLKKSKK